MCVWGGVHVCGECGVSILYMLRENLNVKHSLQEGSAQCERIGELKGSVLIKSRFMGFENGTGPRVWV